MEYDLLDKLYIIGVISISLLIFIVLSFSRKEILVEVKEN